MSDCFNAGASLIPSPVIPTTWPYFWNFSTINNFCSGVVLVKTNSLCATNCSHCDSSNRFNSGPVTLIEFLSLSPKVFTLAIFSLVIIPHCLAIDTPVNSKSPVIMTILIPASLKMPITWSIFFLGGSSIPTNPINIKPELISSFNLFALVILSAKLSDWRDTIFDAKRITLLPSLDHFLWISL